MHTTRPLPRRGALGPTWALACSALLIGCSAAPDPQTDTTWVPLVLAESWQPAPAGADPMAHPTGSDVLACGRQDWHPELDGLEIQTTHCNYAVVQQLLLRALRQGDPLRVRVWWQTLVSPEPVEGHLALLVGEHLVWEERVRIPGPAASREVELASPLSAPAGATVTFHLHNHGSNAWNLNEFALRAPSESTPAQTPADNTQPEE
ncbi:hypothetical protein [Hyalangium gracile]|uniref:hypothetical protein n=1 Tax=Hyalangium gracile TaxID=394092 RepID=UPI001CCE5387|nr:hypothetical protein [Hyalangium gracile]